MYEYTNIPSYLPMPRFLLNCPISNTAKLLYIRMLGKAQLSQKNEWFDNQGRVYFIYSIHQIAVDMDKSKTTIKMVVKELVIANLLEKIPEGRGCPNKLYILFPDEEVGQKSDVGKSHSLGQKTVQNHGGKLTTSKYISNKKNNLLRDYDYDEKRIYGRVLEYCQPICVKSENHRREKSKQNRSEFEQIFQG